MDVHRRNEALNATRTRELDCAPRVRPKTIRIKDLRHCIPAQAYFWLTFMHHDKVTYHVSKTKNRGLVALVPLLQRLGPILDLQTRQLPEGAIVGHQNGVGAQRVRADQQIQRRENPALTLCGCSDGPINRRCGGIPRQDVNPAQEFPDRVVECDGVRPLGQTEKQLAW